MQTLTPRATYALGNVLENAVLERPENATQL